MEYFLLFSQIIVFLLLVLFANLFDLFTSPFLIILLLISIYIIIWGFISLGKPSYSPFPTPKKENKLIKQGAYKFIRHPIYLGVMLMALIFLFSRFIMLSTFLFVLFVLITNYKAELEEELMIKKHSEYKKYRQKTWKFIPLLF